ncbi:unnamed protein product [Adineta steineri]|uniref:Uncharacterized protein n=1 Tax=Adineta steineri TaxID=433720 RepID=A0A818WVH9_9BILA|nr:unnamed protein product [Adineta steineri]CAF3731523.1 unnamed protein product [Adineta steineri]
MSTDEEIDDEPKKRKASKKMKSSKSKSKQRPITEAASGWSNDIDGDEDSIDGQNILSTQPPIIRQSSRRAAEDILTTDIPTISTEDIEGDDAVDIPPQIATVPQFSVYQIASFEEMEKEFSRLRVNQYIDSKIDIGILYNNLHLQEELNGENQKVWEWDKLFVEIRKSISQLPLDA